MYTSKTKKTDSMLPVYLSDRCGRLYPHSDSGRALYFAAFIYNAGRTHPGRKAWRYSCMCLHHDGAFGTSGVCGRRRSRLCFKTQLRLSSWICGCLLCDGTYSKSGKESRTWQVAFGKLYRTCHRVFFGMLYYYLISRFYLGTPIGLWPLFLYCFLLAVPGDIVLCVLGAYLGKRLIPLRDRM
ncbi:hypothetical protein C823_006804 [Eubacterium plexicaudatum ASF492]|nr:hypothetical protein C823_006804 [Eubacterium plexicaudatum ASF492]